jgi:hypothetical protein
MLEADESENNLIGDVQAYFAEHRADIKMKTNIKL